MSDSTTEEQVREMAKLTLLTNKINPIQEKNLKMYPLVFFNGIKSAKVDFDLSNDQMLIDSNENKSDLEITYQFNKAETRHLRVSYHLEIDEDADNHSLGERYSAITQAVRNLFFKETKVQVFINAKLAYESKNV